MEDFALELDKDEDGTVFYEVYSAATGKNYRRDLQKF
jgi:hypothetical protein